MHYIVEGRVRKGVLLARLIKFTDTNQTAAGIWNLHLLPFYYFVPEDIIKAHSKRFKSIQRNPRKILQDMKLIEYIENPDFAVEISDIVSTGVWYYLDMHSGSGIYSEFSPIWRLTLSLSGISLRSQKCITCIPHKFFSID